MLNIKIIQVSCMGFVAGIISALIGAGGGIIVVPSLVQLGLEQKKAHASSVCIMLAICTVSSVMYLSAGLTSVEQALPYIPTGMLGALIGSVCLSKINPEILRKIFACFSLWVGFRLLLK